MEFYDPHSVPAPNGFFNTGAICYWNALMQSLVSLPAFNRAMLANEASFAKNPIANNIISYLRSALTTNGDTGANTTKFATASNAILSAMITQMRKNRRFVDLEFGNRQESASEGFVLLLDMLKSPEVERVFGNRYKLSSWCPHCNEEIMVTTDQSFQINLFYSDKPTDSKGFRDLIMSHPDEHVGYKCEKCKNVIEKGVRFHTLKMLREIMVVEFNKYMSKDMRWFPREMEFPSTSGKPLKYKLVSIIEHSGGLSGGHYWARSYRPTSATEGKWYKFNDIGVSDADAEPSDASYMMFYHVVEG
jgi:ubiquitin C-terminal hydrolase